MKFSKLIFSIVIATIVFSCKENSSVNPTPTKKELFAGTSSKTWKSIKAEAANTTGLKIDLVGTQPPCYVDNLLILSSNGTFEITEGATKCNPSDPSSILKSNWSLSSDEKYLIADKIVFAGFAFTNPQFEILELTESKFVGKTTLKARLTPQAAEQDYTLTATFEVAK